MAVIEIDNVSKSFDNQPVLTDLSLAIEKGESLVVIGQSGTGKSVLLKHLIGLIQPDAGKIVIDGSDIIGLSFRQLVPIRRRFGMLFQSAALFDSLNVEENVGLGLKESWNVNQSEIRDRVLAKLDLVGLASAAEKYPAELSGGMRKRVGLARAIATDPEILLYDEPTTGLDPITADRINDLILELNERLSVSSIAVTHDMTSAFKIADRLIMLYQGGLEFDGTPDELRQTDNPVVRQFVTGSSVGPIEV